MKHMWTQAEAIELCRQIEAICPEFGCHVALTGGLLYKDSPRKDADILFYRIRQFHSIYIEELFHALESIGIIKTGGVGWVIKAKHNGKPIDCFFPEEHAVTGDTYPEPDRKEIAAITQ